MVESWSVTGSYRRDKQVIRSRWYALLGDRVFWLTSLGELRSAPTQGGAVKTHWTVPGAKTLAVGGTCISPGTSNPTRRIFSRTRTTFATTASACRAARSAERYRFMNGPVTVAAGTFDDSWSAGTSASAHLARGFGIRSHRPFFVTFTGRLRARSSSRLRLRSARGHRLRRGRGQWMRALGILLRIGRLGSGRGAERVRRHHSGLLGVDMAHRFLLAWGRESAPRGLCVARSRHAPSCKVPAGAAVGTDAPVVVSDASSLPAAEQPVSRTSSLDGMLRRCTP